MNHDKLQLMVAKLQRKLDREDAEKRAQAVERQHAQELRRLQHEREEAVRIARLKAENAALLKALEAQQRPVHVEVAQIASMASKQAVTPSIPMPTLRAVVDAFLARYEQHGKPQMLKKHRPALNMLIEIVGDKPVSELRQADINEFSDILTSLPPRWKGQCRQRQLWVRELAEMEQEETIGPKTFEDSYLASVRPFLKATKKKMKTSNVLSSLLN